MTPADLLAEADRLLADVLPGTRGRWPRACAWLIRLALEQTLDDYWKSVLPEAVGCDMRAQLLLLPRHAGKDTAQMAADAWFGLAPASHHHACELAPTAAELRSWHTVVTRISGKLADQIRMAGSEDGRGTELPSDHRGRIQVSLSSPPSSGR